VCAGALASLPLARADEDVFVEIGLRVAVVALLALVAALVLAVPVLVPPALVLLGGLYGVQLAVDEAGLDSGATLVAAGLLLTAELAYWSVEEHERVEADPGESLRRLAFVALLVLGALAVAGLLLGVVDSVRTTGLAVDVLGAVAAGAALLAVVYVASRRERA
jgi:ABC-type transport system involved in cytochrome c biogenesis permease subunit